jgi:hypothetical protein
VKIVMAIIQTGKVSNRCAYLAKLSNAETSKVCLLIFVLLGILIGFPVFMLLAFDF